MGPIVAVGLSALMTFKWVGEPTVHDIPPNVPGAEMLIDTYSPGYKLKSADLRDVIKCVKKKQVQIRRKTAFEIIEPKDFILNYICLRIYA